MITSLFLFSQNRYTARNVSIFGVFLVLIFPHSDWILKIGISLCTQSECGKIRTRKTLNTDVFHAVILIDRGILRTLSNILDRACCAMYFFAKAIDSALVTLLSTSNINDFEQVNAGCDTYSCFLEWTLNTE